MYIFLGLFYAHNHDEKTLRLKERMNDVLSFQEALSWPFVGIRQLIAMLARDASPELWTRGNDIVINMHYYPIPNRYDIIILILY